MLQLQHDYDAYYFIADWHALTTNWADPRDVRAFTEEMVLDWCAAGLDPEVCTIYRQSDVPEVAELNLYFSMVTPMSWLERVPSYKEQREQITDKDLGNAGFFLYPLLQAADITIVRADYVPVGEDQLPHLELTREVVRRFNNAYGEYLVEPKAIIPKEGARVPGTDGRKMSKSYGNAIYISDPPDEIRTKVMSCVTDPQRKLKTDPGDPDICPLHQIHKLIAPADEIAEWDRAAAPPSAGASPTRRSSWTTSRRTSRRSRRKRAELAASPDYAWEVLAGAPRARPVIGEVVATCRELVGIDARTERSAGIERRDPNALTRPVRAELSRASRAGQRGRLHRQDRDLRGAVRPAAAPRGRGRSSTSAPSRCPNRRRVPRPHRAHGRSRPRRGERLPAGRRHAARDQGGALLPERRAVFGDEFDDLTPEEARDLLVARLLAYKQFKNVSGELAARMEAEGRMHPRQAGLEALPRADARLPRGRDAARPRGDLRRAGAPPRGLPARGGACGVDADHARAARRERPPPARAAGDLRFSELVDGDATPEVVVVTFLAILELYKRGSPTHQDQIFGEIVIPHIDDEEAARRGLLRTGRVAMTVDQNLRGALEALLFVSDEPVSAARLAKVLEVAGRRRRRARQHGRGVPRGRARLPAARGRRRVAALHASGAPRRHRAVRAVVGHPAAVAGRARGARGRRLPPAGDPQGINAVRGVNTEGVVASLIEKGLVREVGRDKNAGNAILYGTTRKFLEKFGLKDLSELPPLEEFAPDTDTERAIRERLSSGEGPVFGAEDAGDEDLERSTER